MALYRLFLLKRTPFVLVAALLAILCGCGAEREDMLFRYTQTPAQFEMTFPSQYGDVVCDAVWDGDTASLTVRSPERSAGLKITCGVTGCATEMDGVTIPLSGNAAAALTNIFCTLYSGAEEGITPKRSADGTETLIAYPCGILTLNDQLLPCRVECVAMNGEDRTIVIENYTLLPPSEEGST